MEGVERKMRRNKHKLLRKILLIVLSHFYDKKYLTGKYFDNEMTGYYWAIKSLFYQKILRFNPHVPWPISPFQVISNPKNIVFDPDDLMIFQFKGCYFQNFDAKIIIGNGTWIGPNVGLITSNHDVHNLERHRKGENIVIGKNCWIGMNSVILPGVELGDNTIVAAGSIVGKNRKFRIGNSIIAGNPAQIVYSIRKEVKCSPKTGQGNKEGNGLP